MFNQMQSLRDQLRNDFKSGDRRALLEAELLRIQEERRKNLFDKNTDRETQLKRELERLSSSNYTGNLSLKQRWVPGKEFILTA